MGTNTADNNGNGVMTPEEIYARYNAWYERYSLVNHKRDLGEGMTVVEQVINGYWKQRILLNHNIKRGYEFMDKNKRLTMIADDDIEWDSLNGLPDIAVDRVRERMAFYPFTIYGFKNGVSQVCWQINPDGMYYADEDGFGMTDDKEINIYGFIDTECSVVVKFQTVRNSSHIEELRLQAEKAVKGL